MLSFIRALYRYATGRGLIPPVMIAMRKQTCDNCEHKRKGLCREYCTLCKCTVSGRRSPLNKLAHPDEECPMLKWSKIQMNKESKNE